MNQQILEYAKHLNANSEVMDWLNTTGKKALNTQKIDVSELEHVLDYLVSDKAPSRLKKLSVTDAKRKTKEWSSSNQKKGRNLIDSNDDIEVIHDFFDGNKIVKLKTKAAYQREGFFMAHCAGGYDPNNSDCLIYSYRDSKNEPHATFEVKKSDNQIIQIKGKGNGPIHPKYIHPILAFLKSIDMEIRPHDMQNLGYYVISKDAEDYLLQTSAKLQIVKISGVSYAVETV